MSGARLSDGMVGLAAFAGFCALAAWVWLPGPKIEVPTSVGPTNQLADGLMAAEQRMAELTAVTTQRPLFHASRSPEAAPEAPAVPVAPEPTLTLVGILGDQGEEVALVRVSTSTELHQLSVGGRLDRWEVKSINAASISVSKDGEEPTVLEIGE